jgi:hypothetical protein
VFCRQAQQRLGFLPVGPPDTLIAPLKKVAKTVNRVAKKMNSSTSWTTMRMCCWARGKGDHDHAPSCFSLATWDPLTDCCPRPYLWPVACTNGEDDIRVAAALVFYSTFEQLDLPCSGPMDNLDVQRFYECPFAVENDIDWALKDIPGISWVIPNL